ncbi:uncharacterized protein BJ171DRAFT_489421 [Polychytrium aggregatum]|uniref:uncharacterized protein n=1 Tax=Polychytrium aggregatum TaxID=110093 RepID=UPI0022FEC068|nr:uncharacterized protein BJ171DRAFT_489421 [Polychytrium aggregatum]KAI9208589.1 hypothetical protein BJ171DRAFT_489421 [Polychytrium aggregatum]
MAGRSSASVAPSRRSGAGPSLLLLLLLAVLAFVPVSLQLGMENTSDCEFECSAVLDFPLCTSLNFGFWCAYPAHSGCPFEVSGCNCRCGCYDMTGEDRTPSNCQLPHTSVSSQNNGGHPTASVDPISSAAPPPIVPDLSTSTRPSTATAATASGRTLSPQSQSAAPRATTTDNPGPAPTGTEVDSGPVMPNRPSLHNTDAAITAIKTNATAASPTNDPTDPNSLKDSPTKNIPLVVVGALLLAGAVVGAVVLGVTRAKLHRSPSTTNLHASMMSNATSIELLGPHPQLPVPSFIGASIPLSYPPALLSLPRPAFPERRSSSIVPDPESVAKLPPMRPIVQIPLPLKLLSQGNERPLTRQNILNRKEPLTSPLGQTYFTASDCESISTMRSSLQSSAASIRSTDRRSTLSLVLPRDPAGILTGDESPESDQLSGSQVPRRHSLPSDFFPQ